MAFAPVPSRSIAVEIIILLTLRDVAHYQHTLTNTKHETECGKTTQRDPIMISMLGLANLERFFGVR